MFIIMQGSWNEKSKTKNCADSILTIKYFFNSNTLMWIPNSNLGAI